MAGRASRPRSRWVASCFVAVLGQSLLCLQVTSWRQSAFVPVPAALRPPVIVLPGFGNDASDYADGELAFTGGVTSDGGLAARLQRRSFPSVSVLPVGRAEWLRVVAGLLDSDFRAGRAPPQVAFGWYIDRLEDAVKRASDITGERVMLLAHSAGGWLARAALADGRNEVAARTRALVTLGSPHRSPPTEPPGDDQTRGALRFVDESYPGAFLQSQGVEYVTVAGSAVVGKEDAERGTPEREAWVSYRRLVGRGDVAGDGIVPLDNAHLPGAASVTLPGARHSISTPENWYGAEGVIDTWLPQVTLSLARQAALGALLAGAGVGLAANLRQRRSE